MTAHAVVLALTAASALVGAWSLVRVVHRGAERLTKPLVLVLGSISWWSIMSLVAGTAPSIELRLAAFYGLLLGASGLVVGAVWHTVVFTGRASRRAFWWVRLLALEPLAVLVLALVPATRGTLATYRGGDAGPAVPGPAQIELHWAFYAHTAIAYLALGAVAVMLLVALGHAVPGQRRYLQLTIAVMVVPLAANVVSVFVLIDRGLFDLTAVAQLSTALVWWRVDERAGMFHLPLSTEQVLDGLGDAVLVLDPRGRLLRANLAARRLLGDAVVKGRPVAEVLAAPGIGEVVTLGDGRRLEVREREVGTPEVRGRLVVLRDVTDRERLRAELAEQSVRDGLTGLHNRRYLAGALEARVTASLATAEPLAALMIDVDHFKRVNDTLGHAVGDQVLVAIASALTGLAHDEDVLVRFGGEEFLLVLAGADLLSARRRAEQVRVRVREAVERTLVTRGLPVTTSVGVAGLRTDGAALLRDADRALYAAKRAGRDRVVVADDQPVASARAASHPVGSDR